jgi:Uma2 family endonuclease
MVSIVEDEPIVSRDAYTVSYKPTLPLGEAWARDDLEHFADDGCRYEIVDGTLIVSAAPSRLHQRAVLRLATLLDSACLPQMEALIAPFDIVLASDTVLQPDVLVATRRRLTNRELAGAPELAVEVMSPSSRLIDMHLKRQRFAESGCPSYWVVDPSARPAEARLTAWRLNSEKRYEQIAVVTGDEEFHATLPYQVTVVPAALVR